VQAVAAAGAGGVAAIRLFIETPAGLMAHALDRIRSAATRPTGSTR
jgi:hypothetical protein